MPSTVAFAPGRINLIGEHTDYNQGLALPLGIRLGVTVTASALPRPLIEAQARDLQEADSFPLQDPPPADGWRAFVRGIVAELQRSGIELRGARLHIASTLPIGSGLASSAALEVAVALALLGVSGRGEPDRVELAKICCRVESEWVGARTGLLDQLACLMAQEDHALRIDFRSLRLTPVPLLLGQWRLAVLDSGERRANAGSHYNQRREECVQACRMLGITSLREATLQMVEGLPDPLNRRARHVIQSNGRVDQAVQALRQGDLPALGRLLDASQASLRDLYEVSTPALEQTVERLHRAGAAGARLMGGGFGGHVLGLMPPGKPLPDGALAIRPGRGARLLRAELPA